MRIQYVAVHVVILYTAFTKMYRKKFVNFEKMQYLDILQKKSYVFYLFISDFKIQTA